MKASRINYPGEWPQADRDALDALFDKARKDGLWFFHGGLSGPLWFAPDELQERQQKGAFVWGAENWTLRDPVEYLAAAQLAVASASAEYDRIAAKVWKTKPLDALTAAERERCAKIADDYAAACEKGSPTSSMLEDRWGVVHGTAIAKAIRGTP